MEDKKYPNQWRTLILMSLGWGVCGVVQNSIAFLFPYFSVEFGLASAHNGYLMATMALFATISIIGCGAVATRVGQVPVIVPGFLLAAAALCAMALASNVAVIYVGIAVAGFGASAVQAPALSLLAVQCDPRRRGLFYGVAGACFTLVGSSGGSVVLTNLAASPIGWRGTYFCIAAFLAASAAAIGFFARGLSTTSSGEGDAQHKVSELFHYPDVVRCLVLCCLVGVWYFAVASYGVLYLMDAHALTATAAGAIFVGYGIGGFFGEAFVPILSDNVGRKRMVLIAAAGGSVCFPLFLLAPVPAFAMTLLLAGASFCMAGALAILNSVAPSEAAPVELLPLVTSVLPAAATFAGSVVAPLVLGVLSGSFSLSVLMLGLAVAPPLMLAGALFMHETAPLVLAHRALKQK